MNMNTPTSAMTPRGLSRRDFIGSATLSAAALGAFPYVARGRVLGANDRIGVGFIGVGGRGSSHMATVQRLAKPENLQVVAVCDAFRYRLDEAAKPTGAKAYMKHTELLADPNVDVVCIATPDRLHVPQAIDAIRAGKDVYCEKPMGHWSQFDLSQAVLRGDAASSSAWCRSATRATPAPPGRRCASWCRAARSAACSWSTPGSIRNGDWGERMPIPDPEAKPGPDLDWEAFLGDAPKVPFTVDRFFSWRKYLDYAGGPCTDLFPHVFTPFVSAIGLKFPTRAVASGGIFKYTTYDREVPDTFNMCLDYPEKLSVVIVSTLANNYVTEPAIHGDEGTLTLQNPGEWNVGFDSVTVIPRKGERQVFPMKKGDATAAHWQNFLKCVRTREKPCSDVEFGLHVQAALNMAMLSLLKDKVVKFDSAKNQIVV